MNPEIEKDVTAKGLSLWSSDWVMYKAPFPANIRIQIQIAFQEQLDWKATDTIDIDIIRHNENHCGEGAALAKVLSGLFGTAATVLTYIFSPGKATSSIIHDQNIYLVPPLTNTSACLPRT